MGKTLDELRALLHDRQVSREIRVENIFHAHMTQNRRQPLFRRDFRRQAELLAPCRAHGGRNLHHRHRVRIVQRFEYLVRIVALTKRRHRQGVMHWPHSEQSAASILRPLATLTVVRLPVPITSHTPRFCTLSQT